MSLAYSGFTAAMALASALCLAHAWGDRDAMALYGGTVVYGLILEKLVIVAFSAYAYPASRYALSVGGVPLAIAFGWSAVVYAGVLTARALSVPPVAFPGFVGLYALHVDLSMDAVAIRVPYWRWTYPGPWFGVPLGNFFGWFCVATLFAGWFLVLRRRLSGVPLAVGTLVGSLASLLAVLQLWVSFVRSLAAATLVLCGVCALAAVLLVRHRPSLGAEVPHTAFAATLVFHAFFLGVYLSLGLYRTVPALGVVAAGLFALSLAVHAVPGWSGSDRDRVGLGE